MPMPSEMMNHRGISPSFFQEEINFGDERQLGAWKIDHMSGYYGGKANGALRTTSVASSPLDNRLDNQMKRGFELPEYYRSPGRNVNFSSGKQFRVPENAGSRSLPATAGHDIGARTTMTKASASSFLYGDTRNLMDSQFENSHLSSSLSHVLSQKLTISSNNDIYSQSVTDAATSNHEEEGALESLEEIEAQTIGNLLPDDDDDLFSGVSDGLDITMRPNNGEDLEDQDLFSSVGGLELGDDGSLLKNFVLSDVNTSNQHRGGSTRPSRTLFVRNINSNIMDSDLQRLFEQYGDVRTLYTASKHRGFVIVSYYDIRASCNAMKALQNKSLMHRKLDIHFSIPKENPSGNDKNQGTVTVFNPDSSISNNELHEIFGVYGDILEVRETLHSNHHKLVEFFDIRAAESAHQALNRIEIAGKLINFETNRPSGSKSLMESISSELELEESGRQWLQHNVHDNLTTTYSNNGANVGYSRPANRGLTSPFSDNVLNRGLSSSVPNSMSSLLRGEHGVRSNIAESDQLSYMKFALQGSSNLPPPSPNLPPQSPNPYAHSPNLHPQSPNLHARSPNLHARSPSRHPQSPNLHPHSLPEYYDGPINVNSFGSPGNLAANINVQPQVNDNQQFHRISSNGHLMELNEVFGSPGNGSCPSPGHQYMRDNLHHQQSQAVGWPNSPSFANGIGVGHPQQLRGVQRPPSMMNPLLSPNHHVGSAPSMNHSIWERRHAYANRESPDAAMFLPGSLGSSRISGNSLHPLDLLSPDAFSQAGGNCMDMPISSKGVGLHPHHRMMFSPRGQMVPMMSPYDSPSERARHRRIESPTTPGDNRKQFELDVDRILRGDDKRTTLMIKNIPNKYTSKMLLAAIDERHRGTYDFIYLPIDFKNKCNVGYAFINITDPSLIVPFYQTFNGKKWEKFNSEKVATLAYARIQGKSALIAHFQNSSLMNEDKRCRPILFHTDGPNAGDQVPFPMGTNMRPRGGKTRSSNEENNPETPSVVVIKDDYNEDSSSGSGKESD